MGTTRTKRRQSSCRAGIEISRNHLTLVVVDGEDARRVCGYRLPWSVQSGALSTDEGQRELMAAFTTLVAKEKLAGARIRIALNSDFSVTRVVAGEAEKVRREVRDLRERSAHYLWLGADEKALAESSRPIDAKQIQTWLTVTDGRTLTTVAQTAGRAGLQVELVEHSMLATCRALGRTGQDQDGPVILIELNQRGVDLGVSYQGQLLFDYRPGGIDSKEHVAEIVARHLDRIQRYCNRYFRFASGKISQVFLCGEPEDVARVRQHFARSTSMQAEVLDLKAVCPDWEYEDAIAEDTRFAAALGSALVTSEQLEQPREQRGLPDLMDHFRKAWKEPLFPALARLAWPIAAAVLLATGVFVTAVQMNRKASALESQAAGMQAGRQHALQVKLNAQETLLRSTQLQQVAGQILNPPWNEVVNMAGRCLPKGAWLESIRIDQEGGVAITGSSETEDLVYEFVRHLKKVPVLQNVSLEAQRPTRRGDTPLITFDVKCDFVKRSDQPERMARND